MFDTTVLQLKRFLSELRVRAVATVLRAIMPERTSTSTATSCTVAESVVNIAQATGSDMDSAVVPAVPSPVPSNVSTISGSSSERLNFVAGQVAAAPSMTGATTPVPMPVILSPAACGKPSRDSSWLELDICRDFQTEGGCARREQCRFAHTNSSVVTRDGKVTCCYDFLKVSRCTSLLLQHCV